jgi:hypothetical protein
MIIKNNHGGGLPDGVPARRSYREGGAEKFIDCLPAVALPCRQASSAQAGVKSENLSFWK